MGAGASVADFDDVILEQWKESECFCPVQSQTDTPTTKLQFLPGSGSDVSTLGGKVPSLEGAKSWFCNCLI